MSDATNPKDTWVRIGDLEPVLVTKEDEPEWYEDLLKTMGWTNE